MMGTQTLAYVAFPQTWLDFTLHSSLRPPQIAELDFYLTCYGIWMIFKGPYT